MKRLPISVCIIAKNEEKYIEGCLKRLKTYGFEIIVADTGSVDKTKELARKYADKVLDFEWINDFSAARNYCADNASNDWILALDCDEYIDQIDTTSMLLGMKQYPKLTGSIRVKSILIHDDGSEGCQVDDITRFYNKKYYTFINPIHEEIVSIDVKKREEILKSFIVPSEVTHYGYALTGDDKIRKQKRNLELLLKQLEKQPKDSYMNYQAGVSYYIMGDDQKAFEYLQRGLNFTESFDASMVYVIDMITILSQVYIKLGRSQEAVTLMEQYYDHFQNAKYCFAYALAYEANEQPLKALLMYIKASSLSDADTLGDNITHCYERISEISSMIGEFETAERYKEKLSNYQSETDEDNSKKEKMKLPISVCIIAKNEESISGDAWNICNHMVLK